MDRKTAAAVHLCFLLSGAAGLIYEVVWARQLSLFLGITAYAHTAVITAYMIGLAAGSLALGRLSDRRAGTLRLYAALEAGVGLYAALTPWLFAGIQSAYAATAGSIGVTGLPSHLLRFLLALLSLLAPAFLMGGTLPVLVRGVVENLPNLASVTGRLYGLNTLGAALGTLCAGYLFLPALGVRGTIFLAVGLNLGVAAAALLLSRRPVTAPAPPAAAGRKGPAVGKPPPAALPLSRPAARVLLAGFALSGFAALVYELAWIRALTQVIGSSVYAFSTTLAVYLAGLALGSLLYSGLLAGKQRGPALRLGLAAALEVAIGFSALLGLVLIGRLPALFLEAFRGGLQSHFAAFHGVIFGLCFLLMILPTLLLGALFPLVTALWASRAVAVGRGVGSAYAANTAGTVLGSLLGGLVLLPSLGVHYSVLLAAGLHLLAGCGLWFLRPAPARQPQRYLPAIAALVLFGLTSWLLPPWDRDLMSSGVFDQPDWYLARPHGQGLGERARSEKLLFYEEEIDGTVAVKDTGLQRTLIINGKADASSLGDLPTQVMLGELPLLIHPDPKSALIVGLGSGITAGSMAVHDSLQAIIVLEISPAVVRASSHFAGENHDVLSDPRVDLVVADARNYL